MDITATLQTELSAAALYPVLVDLGTYPAWIGIVSRAVPEAPTGADGARHTDDAEELPAWSIDLRGQLGPLRRSKRLRMQRTEESTDRYVRFDRAELDGRNHSEWTLSADLREFSGGTELTMRLFYGGTLWMPMLDKLLRDEIERSRESLVAYASR